MTFYVFLSCCTRFPQQWASGSLTAKYLAVLCFYPICKQVLDLVCQISTDLDKILHTPIVVRNSHVGRLRPRSARWRLQAKPERLFLPARRRPQGLVVIGVCLSVCLCALMGDVGHGQRAGLCPPRTQ